LSVDAKIVTGFLYGVISIFKGDAVVEGEKLRLLSRMAVISNATGIKNYKKKFIFIFIL
jgi:hypothetical protein